MKARGMFSSSGVMRCVIPHTSTADFSLLLWVLRLPRFVSWKSQFTF